MQPNQYAAAPIRNKKRLETLTSLTHLHVVCEAVEESPERRGVEEAQRRVEDPLLRLSIDGTTGADPAPKTPLGAEEAKDDAARTKSEVWETHTQEQTARVLKKNTHTH